MESDNSGYSQEYCEQMLPRIEAALDKRPDIQVFEDYITVLMHYEPYNLDVSLAKILWLRPRAVEMMEQAARKQDWQTAERYHVVLYLTYRERARYYFEDYIIAVEFERDKKKRFYFPRQRYLQKITEAYQDIADGNLKLLTISLPKRAGKSQESINFVNWMSGRFIDRSSLIEGTGDDLVRSFYDGCLEYLVTPNEYKFFDIFPQARLKNTNADTKTFNLGKRKRFPSVMCRSIEARQVGLSEATNVLALDDCVAGREEAMNRDLLDKKWQVISGDVIGRALEGTPIVMTGTRYSLYDPIGRMQDFAKERGWNWKAIEIPALDPMTDESNYEFFNPMIEKKMFTTEYFREQRSLLTDEQFESEFQQMPFEAKGLMFPKDDLQYFTETPTFTNTETGEVEQVEPDVVIAYVDPAGSGKDSTTMWIDAVYGEMNYLIDVVWDNSPASITENLVANAIIKYKVSDVCCESNNGGDLFINDVANMLKERGYRCGIRTKRTNGNKQAKIEHNSPGIIQNFLFRSWQTLTPNTPYWGAMREVTTYTRSGKVPHDDAPDCLAMLNMDLTSRGNGKVEVFARPF